MGETAGVLVYYLILLLLFIFYLLKKLAILNDTWIIVFSALLFIFLATFKAEGVDKDYKNYVESFSEVGSPLDYFRNYDQWFFFEIFFYLIPSIVKLFIQFHYEIVCFFIFSLAGTFLVFKVIKRFSLAVWISILYYYCSYFFLQGLTQIRVAIACGCLLWCIHFYYERKFKLFFLFAAIGFLFQYTAILILVILIFDRTSFNVKRYSLIVIAALIISLLRSDVILQPLFMLNVAFVKKLTLVLSGMSEEQNTINIFNVGFVLNLSATFWLIKNYKKLIEISPHIFLYLKIQVLSILFYCLFTSIAVVSFRIYEFFGVINILTIPLLLHSFKSRTVGYVAAIGYSLVLFLINIQFTKLVGPYKLIFFS